MLQLHSFHPSEQHLASEDGRDMFLEMYSRANIVWQTCGRRRPLSAVKSRKDSPHGKTAPNGKRPDGMISLENGPNIKTEQLELVISEATQQNVTF